MIRCPDLRGCSEQEILDEMKSQGVTAVKRFRVRKDGQLKYTNTFVFTFNTPILPTTIKIAFFRVNVDVYIPNPRFAASSTNSMAIMKINVKTTLYVQNAANRLYIMKRKNPTSVSTVEKATLQTQRNVKLGLKKKKY